MNTKYTLEYYLEEDRKKKEKMRRHYFKKKYNISLERYDEILKSQNGCCAICKELNPSERRLAVDHCHDSNLIRGLLCARCNLGIGFFKNNEKIITEAVNYLERFQFIRRAIGI